MRQVHLRRFLSRVPGRSRTQVWVAVAIAGAMSGTLTLAQTCEHPDLMAGSIGIAPRPLSNAGERGPALAWNGSEFATVASRQVTPSLQEIFSGTARRSW